MKTIKLRNITTDSDSSCFCSVWLVDGVEVVKSGAAFSASDTDHGREAIKKLDYCLSNPSKRINIDKYSEESGVKEFAI